MFPQKPGLRRGDQVRITRGPMAERLAIYDGMKGRERVEVLLAMLGSVQRVELAPARRRGDDRLATGKPAGCVLPVLLTGGLSPNVASAWLKAAALDGPQRIGPIFGPDVAALR